MPGYEHDMDVEADNTDDTDTGHTGMKSIGHRVSVLKRIRNSPRYRQMRTDQEGQRFHASQQPRDADGSIKSESFIGLFGEGMPVQALLDVLNGREIHEDYDTKVADNIALALIDSGYDEHIVDVQIDESNGKVFIYLDNRVAEALTNIKNVIEKYGPVELTQKPDDDPKLSAYVFTVGEAEEEPEDDQDDYSYDPIATDPMTSVESLEFDTEVDTLESLLGEAFDEPADNDDMDPVDDDGGEEQPAAVAHEPADDGLDAKVDDILIPESLRTKLTLISELLKRDTIQVEVLDADSDDELPESVNYSYRSEDGTSNIVLPEDETQWRERLGWDGTTGKHQFESTSWYRTVGMIEDAIPGDFKGLHYIRDVKADCVENLINYIDTVSDEDGAEEVEPITGFIDEYHPGDLVTTPDGEGIVLSPVADAPDNDPAYNVRLDDGTERSYFVSELKLDVSAPGDMVVPLEQELDTLEGLMDETAAVGNFIVHVDDIDAQTRSLGNDPFEVIKWIRKLAKRLHGAETVDASDYVGFQFSDAGEKKQFLNTLWRKLRFKPRVQK